MQTLMVQASKQHLPIHPIPPNGQEEIMNRAMQIFVGVIVLLALFAQSFLIWAIQTVLATLCLAVAPFVPLAMMILIIVAVINGMIGGVFRRGGSRRH